MTNRYSSMSTIPSSPLAITTITGRYQKELTLYGAEVVENKKKLDSTTAAAEGGEESWEIRNAVRDATILWLPSSLLTFVCTVQKSLIRESENMVRDTAARLERAAGELGDLVVRWPIPAYRARISAPSGTPV